MDLTRDANEEFEEQMVGLRSLVGLIEEPARDRLGVFKNPASWEDVRVLGDIIDVLEEAVQCIEDL